MNFPIPPGTWQPPQQPAMPGYPQPQQPAMPGYPPPQPQGQPAMPGYPPPQPQGQPAMPGYPPPVQPPAVPTTPTPQAMPWGGVQGTAQPAQPNWGAPNQQPVQQAPRGPVQPIQVDLNDPAIANYSVKAPFLPYERAKGAEGTYTLELKNIYFYSGNKGQSYRCDFYCHQQLLPDGSVGAFTGRDCILAFGLERDSKIPYTFNMIMGRFGELIRCIAGIQEGQQVDVNALREYLFELGKNEQLGKLTADGSSVILQTKRTCGISKQGKEFCNDDWNRLR